MTKAQLRIVSETVTIPTDNKVIPDRFTRTYGYMANKETVPQVKVISLIIGNTKQCGTEYVLVRTAEKPDMEDRKYCGSNITTVMEIKSTVYVQIKGENFAKVDQLKPNYKSGREACVPVCLCVEFGLHFVMDNNECVHR
ncbi:hypothetical protein FGIG_10375 [Fasciola gigantica]|uniref:Uncharacterized protein n=1 Tax=Fasciola gigantica TaxID=46835 RepID=A0A504YWN9_FASGI|nr:hypothetical protein FGIG_10375 [Fasciola gigantica]